jgi:primosomal protein N' (replication factor Y)
MPIYQIAVFQTNRDYFDYTHPAPDFAIGSRVWVPFRNKTRLGVVVGSNQTDTPSLKTIIENIDIEPLITSDILNLCHWMSDYYQAPLAQVLALVLPKTYRQGKLRESLHVWHYQLAVSLEEAYQKLAVNAHKQRELLAHMHQQTQPVSRAQLQSAGYSLASIQGLVDKAILSQEHLPQRPCLPNVIMDTPLSLNTQQQLAYETIHASLHHYQCFLLFGVTGSGKTEVYCQLITDVLRQRRQVLILVPEIGLTPQLQQRFQARFAQSMVVIHSQMSEGERQQAWQWAADNQVQLVIGTRSALFTPMPALGLIVIDEEHDTSLKQMDGVRYLARDTALMRAHAANIPIILGSATPSLESLANADKGKYTMLRLTQKAMNTVPLHYELVDLRSQTLQQGLANRTLAAIKKHLEANHQVLIFINRRGFSPVLLCHTCGWKALCQACDVSLTAHKHTQQLMCHHCGHTQRYMLQCPQCAGRELIHLGAGTQRIEEVLQQLFPSTVVLRIDRDAVRKKHAFDQHLEKIHAGDAQLIIGTQMLAKGHHFSNLSLVVVLDADYGFYDQDFRALERLGQLLTQVSGRAGRADIAGEVVIQTHLPDHPLLNTLIKQGYEPFAQALLKDRRQGIMPPYAFMALFSVQGRQQEGVLAFIHAAKQAIRPYAITVMGPAPAPMAKKAHYHRMQLLLKSDSRQRLHTSLTALRTWIITDKRSHGLRWTLDVDPVDLN